MSKVFLVLVFALLCQSCTGADRVATYSHKNSGAAISIALTAVHPHLAEYERDLVVQTATGVMNRKKLFPDTGGICRSQSLPLFRWEISGRGLRGTDQG